MADSPEAAAEGSPRLLPDEPMDRKFWRAVSAECLAMFLFVFVCVGCALTTLGIAEGANASASYTATLAISLCFGFTIFVLAHCFGHISGAHINPAVTAALMASKMVSFKKGFAYILAHCVGSVAASAVLMGIMGLEPDTMGGYNAIGGDERSKTRVMRGVVTEVVLTFLLVFTVFATIDPSREKTGNGPRAIGMAVGVAHLCAVPITGCGINPARSLGPAILATNAAAKTDLWVFLFAPFVGAIFAKEIYTLWFAENAEDWIGEGLRSFYQAKKAEASTPTPEPRPISTSQKEARADPDQFEDTGKQDIDPSATKVFDNADVKSDPKEATIETRLSGNTSPSPKNAAKPKAKASSKSKDPPPNKQSKKSKNGLEKQASSISVDQGKNAKSKE